jgi:large subunit ribosomal protein L4
MKSSVYSIDGKESRSIELKDEVFALPYNEEVVWYAINNELANRRLGTASTKDRAEVHGSNAKPYKQKGTGRARRGDKKSPVLVGGGVIFGPRPKDYSYTIPKKAKRLAMKTILSLKAQNNMLKVVEDFSIDSGKTKDMAAILKNLGIQEKAVLVLGSDDSMLKRAASNIANFKYLAWNRLSAHTLFYGKQIIIQESAVKSLNDFYSGNNESAEAAE